MRRRVVTAAVAVVALVAVAGCGVPGQSEPTALGENGVRVEIPTSTTSIEPATPTRRAELCLVSGTRLAAVSVQLPTPLTVRRTLKALVDAPKSVLPHGLRSAINDPKLLTAREQTRGVAQVSLNTEFTKIAPADQILALAQVVCTLTSLPGIGQVHFTDNGKAIDIPRADASLTNKAVSRFDYQRLMPKG